MADYEVVQKNFRVMWVCEGCERVTDSSSLLRERKPCTKCGGALRRDGDEFVQEKALAGCVACGWWGPRAPVNVDKGCPHCEDTPTVPLVLAQFDGVWFSERREAEPKAMRRPVAS